MTVWVTFVPCFLWIFLGAPYIEVLRGQSLAEHRVDRSHCCGGDDQSRRIEAAPLRDQQAQSYPPDLADLSEKGVDGEPDRKVEDDPHHIGAFFALFRWKLGMLKTLGLSAVAGVVWFLGIRKLLGL